MADPRAVWSVEGVGSLDAPYKIDNSTIVYDSTKAGGCASVGLAVTLSAAGTVALAADGDRVIGKLWSVESDNFARVQVKGYMTLPGGASATLTLNLAIVGALGAASAKGYIRVAASGTAAELVKCRGSIQDSGTATAVVVLL